MLKIEWFRRKKDNKALARNAEQEISTIKKMAMIEKARRKLDSLHIERRFHMLPIDLDRRRV